MSVYFRLDSSDVLLQVSVSVCLCVCVCVCEIAASVSGVTASWWWLSCAGVGGLKKIRGSHSSGCELWEDSVDHPAEGNWAGDEGRVGPERFGMQARIC